MTAFPLVTSTAEEKTILFLKVKTKSQNLQFLKWPLEAGENKPANPDGLSIPAKDNKPTLGLDQEGIQGKKHTKSSMWCCLLWLGSS